MVTRKADEMNVATRRKAKQATVYIEQELGKKRERRVRRTQARPLAFRPAALQGKRSETNGNCEDIHSQTTGGANGGVARVCQPPDKRQASDCIHPAQTHRLIQPPKDLRGPALLSCLSVRQ